MDKTSAETETLPKKGEDQLEINEMILAEVRLVRGELKDHISDESIQFEKIKSDISELSIQAALNRQQGGYVAGFISMMVAAAVSWVFLKFGGS